MQGLFDPARHESLTATAWNEEAARGAIVRIFDAAAAEFDGAAGWPAHPLDEPNEPGAIEADLYMGAGGVVWALRHLAAEGAATVPPELMARMSALVPGLAARARTTLQGSAHGTASYLCGEAGLLLLHWQCTQDPTVADALFDVVRGNLHNPAREPLWGNAGSVLAAIAMAEATGEARWRQLVQDAVAVLLQEMQLDPETGTWVWEQDLYGRRARFLGAGHGLVGNVFPALRAAAMLDADTVATLVERAFDTLSATALRAGNGINWHPMIDPARVAGRLPPVQDCHGAPGVVCRLAHAPRSAGWDALLRGAGELSWAAGPLTKGASICHGTSGSVLAMLKLWRRFGEPLWLDRARRLAMHAAEQVETHRATYGQGRHTLWTGDLGPACVLWACIGGDDRFPTLDRT